jgi:hypothetical protein
VAASSVSNQVDQQHHEGGEQRGDGEEIAENFDADLAARSFRSTTSDRRAPGLS